MDPDEMVESMRRSASVAFMRAFSECSRFGVSELRRGGGAEFFIVVDPKVADELYDAFDQLRRCEEEA